MKMKLRFTLLLMLIASISFGQSLTGGIAGKVIDGQGKPLDYASVKAVQGGLIKGGSYTDEDGFYSIKPLPAGTYDIKITYIGYPEVVLTGILVAPSKTATRNVTMQKSTGGAAGEELKTVYIRADKLIDITNPASDIKSGKDLAEIATTSVGDMVATFAGVKQTNGAQVSIGGDRTDGTQYFIDGVPVLGSRAVSLSPRALGSAQVMRTGMAAKYGNATGGIVQLTSAPVSAITSGGLQVQTSVDGYFNNLVSLDLSGPLYTKNKGKAGERIKLGYFVNLAGRYNKDSDPSYYKYNVLKEDVRASIEETPLFANPSGGSFLEASEAVTAADFRQIKAREQGDDWNINYLGKLDYQPTQKINLTLGTYFDYTRFRGFSRLNGMFAPQANGLNNSYTGRAYLRFSQSLGRTQTAVKDTDIVKSAFSNAFYTVQLSYQRDYSDGANPQHGRNVFDYGYVGKFEQETTPFYTVDTALGYSGIKYLGDQTTQLNFTRGGVNPLLENYTAQVMSNENIPINNLGTLQAFGGLINGFGPSTAYNLFSGPGSQISTFSYGQEDRVNLNLDAAFDLEQGLKNRGTRDPIVHSIEFGMGFEQRTNRNYFNNASQLWNLINLYTNSHLRNLDVNNPIYVVNGQEYTKQQLDDGVVEFSEFDTIRYNRLPATSDQSRFDKSLREKLFNNENALNIIDAFNLDRSNFSLDMFSADDLYNAGANANNGAAYVSYNGYDYLGNIQRKQPSFNDFWTKRDGRGDLLRPIAAYNPNYMFGYIQDNFTYKDINFNIGVRIDRFDNNQNVLRDPYSLYGVNKLGNLNAGDFKLAYDEATRTTAPNPFTSGFDKDWVTYVDNNQSNTPTIVGFRKGDVWFDPFGREIADPTVLSEKYANGLPIQPSLVDPSDSIKSENYKIGNAFEDYTPDVTVSPRIQFTFPVGDKSLFYGNYDIVTQYPRSRSFVSPDDYYFLGERQGTINNANLRMSKSINYTLGFEQALSDRSKVGLEVAYSERKDQVQVQQYILAYPIAYTSFGNRDFSSTKRFIFKYDLRRSRKKYTPLSMNIAYTLQFAEGTGSNETSAQTLIASGQPNLRTVFPLSFDSRHQFSFVFDYRFGDKIGPSFKTKNGKEHFWLGGVSANLLINANSGDPFTRSSIAVPVVGGGTNGTPIVGTVNGSRRPWNQELGLRLQKSMSISRLGRKKDTDGNILTESGRPLSINVFTFVQNLLNTRNVVGVYSYTGVADDDGYLASPQGVQFLNSGLFFPQSYQDLYGERILNPNNFGRPRRINVGFTLSF